MYLIKDGFRRQVEPRNLTYALMFSGTEMRRPSVNIACSVWRPARTGE